MSFSSYMKENTAKLALAASMFGLGGVAQAQTKPVVPDVKVDITGLIERKIQKLAAPKINGVQLESKTPVNLEWADDSKAKDKIQKAMVAACDAKGMLGSLTGSITVQTVNGGQKSPTSTIKCAVVKADDLLNR